MGGFGSLSFRRPAGPGDFPDFGLGRAGRDPDRARRVGRRLLSALAALFVLFALVAPDDLTAVSPATLVRIPVEGLIVVAFVVVLPPRARRWAAVAFGLVLGLLTVLKALDTGFYATLEKPFDPVYDWSFFGAGVEFLGGQIGHAWAIAAVAGAAVLAVVLVVLMVLAVLRVTRIVAGHRTASTRVVALLSVVWIVSAMFGLETAPGQPIAAQGAAALAYDDLRQVGADLREQQHPFAEQAAADAYRRTPGDQLLGGLRGKDVVLTFVESYGRLALEDPDIAPKIGATLDAGTAQLRAAGIGARSAFLSSSTFGGGSWLAHSTVQSGMWIDNQQRYNDLLGSDRLTLGGAFQRAGWRTVWDVPAHTKDWPEGQRFYHPDGYYDFRSIGYHGPGFAYATMPDQFTFSMLQRKERAPGHRPVMAEVDLVSSHAPWSPRPWLVDWNAVGDGSVFAPQPAAGEAPESVWRDPAKIRDAYRDATDYSLRTVISYLQNYGDENLVLVFLGDHQPPVVTPQGASHDVPITIVAKDPKVLDRIAGWGWQDGLHPGAGAPVWKMDTFRDRFLTAFAR